MLKIGRKIGAFDMPFRISRHTDTKGEIFFNELHQFVGVTKPIVRSDELLLPLRRITPQRQDIFNTAILQSL